MVASCWRSPCLVTMQWLGLTNTRMDTTGIKGVITVTRGAEKTERELTWGPLIKINKVNTGINWQNEEKISCYLAQGKCGGHGTEAYTEADHARAHCRQAERWGGFLRMALDLSGCGLGCTVHGLRLKQPTTDRWHQAAQPWRQWTRNRTGKDRWTEKWRWTWKNSREN